MGLQEARYYGAPAHSNFPVYPNHQTYIGGDGRLQRNPDQHFRPRYNSQRYFVEPPPTTSEKGTMLQNSARNVTATSYMPSPPCPGQKQPPPPVYVDFAKNQPDYVDRGSTFSGGSHDIFSERPLMSLAVPEATVCGGPGPQDPIFLKDGLVFMRFYDDKCHCSSCSTLGACFEELSMRYRQANFFDANVNANGKALSLLKIDYLPTVIAFRDRRELGRYFGTELHKLERFVHEMAHKLS